MLTRRRFLALGATVAAWPLAACRPGASRTDQNVPNGIGGTAPGTTPTPAASGSASASTAAVVVTAAPTPPAPELSGDPFRLGVTSGDPEPDGVVLWTRLAPDPQAWGAGMADFVTNGVDFAVAWDVAEDEGFGTLVGSGQAAAPADAGHSVHVTVTGLAPNRWYHYRFRIGPWTSRTGRTRTSPAHDDRTTPLVIAAAACQHFEHGTFVAQRHLAAEHADLVLFLGDFMYEDGASGSGVRSHPPDTAVDLAGYRHRYAWYRADPDLQDAAAAAPWAVIWDDHEVQNNYAAANSVNDGATESFALRRAAAYRAWWENQPTRLPPPTDGVPFSCRRSLRWGGLVHLVLLDGRSQRSVQVCGGSFGDGAACVELADPRRTMLGEDQQQWVRQQFNDDASSDTTWTVLGNQTALADLTVDLGDEVVTLFDQWDGYPKARQRLLQDSVEAGVANLVALTGDLHCAMVNDLRLGSGSVGSLGNEIVVSSISSRFADGRGALFEFGLGLLDQVAMVDTRRRGYVRVELHPTLARFAFRHVNDALNPQGTIATTSTWERKAGTTTLRRI
ncbi:MAG: alkaline phosphatase D family protein [Acidimicrobiales bacterium]